jgi:hypothetical protein
MAMHHGSEESDVEGKGPVTVIVNAKPRNGKIKAFEEWMDGIIHESMKFEGHMG